MKYDFDTVYNRKGTNSVKYKIHSRYPEISDLIPMWIADMDFKTAPEIVSALRYASDEGIFGYTELDDAYYDLLIDWYKKRFDFNINGGYIFGKGGSDFMRMNIACPRKTLEEAVFRIKSQIKENKYE